MKQIIRHNNCRKFIFSLYQGFHEGPSDPEADYNPMCNPTYTYLLHVQITSDPESTPLVFWQDLKIELYL